MRWIHKGLVPLATLILAAVPAAAQAYSSSSGVEVPVTAPAPPQPPGPPPSVAALEAQDLATINAERASAGLAPVKSQPWAAALAETQSQKMAASQSIWHDMSGYMAQGHQAMGASYLGENVAMDSTLDADAQLLFSDPPHRAITLDPRFNYVGVGVALDSRNWVYLTENYAEIGAGGSRVAPVSAAAAAPARPAAAPKPAPVVKPAPAPAPAPVVAVPAAPVPAVPVAPLPAVHTTPSPAPAHAPLAARPVSHTSPLPGLGMIAGVLLTTISAAAAAMIFGQRLAPRSERRSGGTWRPGAPSHRAR